MVRTIMMTVISRHGGAAKLILMSATILASHTQMNMINHNYD